jgi:hypothetical protein
MSYNEAVFFRCELHFKDPNFKKIKNLLISILGQPKEAGKLHPYIAVDKNGKLLKGEGYQLKLTPENLVRLHEKCMQLNISFVDVFERDWRHFHLNYYIGDDKHEGTAYEHAEHWEIFYEGGSLSDLPGLKENNFFIQKIYKKDINDLSIINLFFEKWVKENIG